MVSDKVQLSHGHGSWLLQIQFAVTALSPQSHVIMCFTGSQQGHSHSQRGHNRNAGQLWPGVLSDEVLHWAHE